MKRVLDLALSVPVLMVVAPLIVVLAVLVRLQSSGPGILRQPRVGQHRTEFTCYKLRTMYTDTKVVPSHEVGAAAITTLGSILRRLKLDELPQLFNVVRGDMSLVGPRPCLPTQVELIAAREAAGVFDVRPGITGLVQVQGIDMSDPQCLAMVDAEYVQGQSILGDLRLLWQTLAGAGISGDPAAQSRNRAPSGGQRK